MLAFHFYHITVFYSIEKFNNTITTIINNDINHFVVIFNALHYMQTKPPSAFMRTRLENICESLLMHLFTTIHAAH